MKKKLIALCLVLAMLACLFVGCTPAQDSDGQQTNADNTQTDSNTDSQQSTDGVTNLTVIRPGDEEKVASFMEPAIAQFNEDNPDIHVEIKYESWAGWIQTYPTYFEADTQPDVVFWWDNKMFDSSAHDHFVDLSPYFDDEFRAQIPESVWNLVATDGMDGMCYIPSSVDPFVLYYNKDVFTAAGLDPEDPPETWDELLAAAKAIHDNAGVAGIGVPAITGSEVLQEFVGVFLNQANDGPILDGNSQPAFNTDAGLEALEFLEQLWPYVQDSPTEYGRGELRPLLRDGQIGMLIDGPWAIPTFTEAFGEDLDNSIIGIAAMPVPESGVKINWAGTNGWVATREETAEASARLIAYLMSPEVLEAHHIAYGSAPLYESEFDNPVFQYDYWNLFYDETINWTLYGMIGKNSPTPGAYYTALEEVWQQFMFGQLNAQEAMDAAVAAAQNVSSRNE